MKCEFCNAEFDESELEDGCCPECGEIIILDEDVAEYVKEIQEPNLICPHCSAILFNITKEDIANHPYCPACNHELDPNDMELIDELSIAIKKSDLED